METHSRFSSMVWHSFPAKLPTRTSSSFTAGKLCLSEMMMTMTMRRSSFAISSSFASEMSMKLYLGMWRFLEACDPPLLCLFQRPEGIWKICIDRIVRRRLAPAVTALRFELIPPVPAEPPMDIAIGAFPADHLPVVSLSVGQIAHDIPNLIRPDNGLSPSVGIPAAHLLFYFRQMSERFRDHLGDRYRLGVSDPALQLRVASNGHQVTFALDHVLHTLSIDAFQFIVMARPGEHQHIWETAFNFQSFYRMVLHVTERSFLQPVWIAREAMWFEHYSSQGSFFLYALP